MALNDTVLFTIIAPLGGAFLVFLCFFTIIVFLIRRATRLYQFYMRVPPLVTKEERYTNAKRYMPVPTKDYARGVYKREIEPQMDRAFVTQHKIDFEEYLLPQTLCESHVYTSTRLNTFSDEFGCGTIESNDSAVATLPQAPIAQTASPAPTAVSQQNSIHHYNELIAKSAILLQEALYATDAELYRPVYQTIENFLQTSAFYAIPKSRRTKTTLQALQQLATIYEKSAFAKHQQGTRDEYEQFMNHLKTVLTAITE